MSELRSGMTALSRRAACLLCMLLLFGNYSIGVHATADARQPNTTSAVPDADTDKEKAAAFEWIDANTEPMNKLALELWNTPELSFREFKSSRAMSRYLATNGFSVKEHAGGVPTAFIGSYGSGKPVIAFWTEEDALAGMSQKLAPAREALTAGTAGHACGHNLIGSSTVVAAVAVAKFLQRTQTNGTVRVYGTPAEEVGGGKEYMLEAGLFKDVDVLLGWHPSINTRTEFEYTKAAAELHFHFTGVAAHASVAPWQGRSALHAVELMDAGVNYLREQLKEDARVQYVISNGGGQPNVIPAEAESWYVVRADKHGEVADIVQWITDIAKGAAMMTRTEVQIRIDDDAPEVVPNRPLAEAIDRNLRLVGTPAFTEDDSAFARKMLADLKGGPRPVAPQVVPLPEVPIQGAYSTDLGNVSWNVPTERLAVTPSPYVVAPHTWQSVVESGTTGLKSMPVAAKTLAATAMDLFKNGALRDAARKDLEDRTKGHRYVLLTPQNRKPPSYPEEATSTTSLSANK